MDCVLRVLPVALLAMPCCAPAAPPNTETAPAGDVSHAAAADTTVGSDWPKFLGPTGDSQSRETGILTDWPTAGPRVLWQRELGISYGIGSVRAGRLYQFDRYGDQTRLTCLDARDGRELWRFEYPTEYEDMYGYNGGPRCSPVVDGDRVYVFGVEGMLYCVRAGDGKPLWHVDTAERFCVIQNFFGVGSTPVIEGRLLLVMVGGSSPETRLAFRGRLDEVQGNGTCIAAFDKMTGEVVYIAGDDLASYASLKLATIGGRRWCFAFARGGLLGFQPTTGEVDFYYPWRAKKLESVNASTPVVVGDEVLISETYGPGSSLLKVRPGGYDLVWRDDLDSRDKAMQTHWNTPVYRDGYLYGSSGRHAYNAELRCIQWKTGKVMWSIPRLTRSSLLYVDGHFVCLGEYGQLFLFKANPEQFQVVAMVAEGGLKDAEGNALLENPCWAAPIIAHKLLYVRGRNRLVCLDLRPDSYD